MTDTLTDWSVSSSCIPVWHITYVTYLTHQTQSGTYRSGISIIIENILFEGLGESILPIIDFFPSKLFLHQKHGHEHKFCLDSRNWLLGKTCLLVIYDQFIENFSERWVDSHITYINDFVDDWHLLDKYLNFYVNLETICHLFEVYLHGMATLTLTTFDCQAHVQNWTILKNRFNI